MGQHVSLAVDIGGTFTDVVVRSGATVVAEKTLTTPDDLLEGFFTGVGAALAKAGAVPGEVDGPIVHATTVVTNALIERKGPRAAMIFTRGFPDILEIRDERRYDMYDPQIEFPKPLVGRNDVLMVDERTYADGTVGREPSDAEIEGLCAELTARGVETVGICLLHAYVNPHNEQLLADELRNRLPGVFVSASSEIAPQIREYLRASTTAVNTYSVPITQPYLDRLEKRLSEEGFASRPLIMLSSGGVVGPGTAGRMPVRMIESGPAAGALGAAHAAAAMGLDTLLAFDMGGTTAKVCLIQESRPRVTGLFEIDRMYRFREGSGLPVTVPSVDLIEIGAGGGSIAHVNEFGLLNVGPRSAGSRPGPACYGRGGTEPTVTDADVVLGAIDAGKFLGGAMPLDVEASERAIAHLAERLGTEPMATARGIYRIVCEAMASAVKTHASDRGVDYRGIPMLAFGGAGPVHACEVAELLKSELVIFPPLASVYSAFGSLVTPARLDLVRSGLRRIDDVDWEQVAAIFAEMESEGRQALKEAGCAGGEIAFRYAADVRYVGQHYDLMVELDGCPSPTDGAQMVRSRFEEEYVKRYTISQDEVGVEVVNWRLIATGVLSTPPDLERALDVPAGEPETRRVHLWEDGQDIKVIPRTALRPGETIEGPVILEEAETTLVIPPAWSASLGAMGCVVARRDV
jgi:N-methylhydantoinase A